MSTTGHTKVSECRNGAVSTFYVHPADFGIAEGRRAAICRAATPPPTPRSFATCSREQKGPRRDVVLLNAGASLFVGGKAGVGARRHRARRGRRSIRARRARTLDAMIAASKQVRRMTSTAQTPDLLAAIVAATRRMVEVRAAQVPLAELERRAAARRAAARALRGRARANGPRQRDRRVQAPFAVAGRAEGRLRSGGDCERLRRARAPRRFRC